MAYVNCIKRKLDQHYKSNSFIIVNELKNKIEIKAAVIEKQARIRGKYVLFYCILTMWNVGYVPDDNSKIKIIPFAIITILFCLSFLFVKLWQNRLLFVVAIWTIFIVLFMVLCFVEYQKILEFEYVNWLLDNIGAICSIIIMLPLIFQTYINWLYTQNYYYILLDKINKEFNLFQRARACNSADDIPAEYSHAYNQSYFDEKNNGQSDTIVSNLTKVLNLRLNDALNIPSFCALSAYALKHIYKTRGYTDLDSPAMEIKGETIPTVDMGVYEKYIKEYFELKPRSSLVSFCRKRNIDYNTFQALWKSFLKNSKMEN